jgi:hypothetical protein
MDSNGRTLIFQALQPRRKRYTEVHSGAQPQPQTIKKKPRMNANEHELDGSIRVNWYPFVVRKFFAKLRDLQPQSAKITAQRSRNHRRSKRNHE